MARSPTLSTVDLYLTTDDGASFTQVAPPATSHTNLLLYGGPDGAFYVAIDHVVYRTTDGAAWELLGTYAAVLGITSTPTGTILIHERQGNQQVLHRRAMGTTMWTSLSTGIWPFSIAARPNGELVRVASNGGIHASGDDGATWTEVLATTQVGVGEVFAYATVVTGRTENRSAARWPTGAATWTVTTPSTLPFGILDLSFSANGKLVAGDRERVYTSTDGGVTWHWGTYLFDDDGTPIRAFAVSPDGAEIAVGSTAGRIALLDGTGDALARTPYVMQGMNAMAGGSEVVQQIAYYRTYPRYALVTTASTDNTQGGVYDGQPSASTSWRGIDPLRAAGGPDFPAGYYAVGACDSDGNGRVVVASRRPEGGSTTEDKLHLRTNVDAFWAETPQPVIDGHALTASCGTPPPDGAAPWLLAYEDEVYLSFPGFLDTANGVPAGVVVDLDDLGGTVRARVAPDNHVWAIGSAGLYRSTQSILEAR